MALPRWDWAIGKERRGRVCIISKKLKTKGKSREVIISSLLSTGEVTYEVLGPGLGSPGTEIWTNGRVSNKDPWNKCWIKFKKGKVINLKISQPMIPKNSDRRTWRRREPDQNYISKKLAHCFVTIGNLKPTICIKLLVRHVWLIALIINTLVKIHSGPSTFMHTFNFLVQNLVHMSIIHLLYL